MKVTDTATSLLTILVAGVATWPLNAQHGSGLGTTMGAILAAGHSTSDTRLDSLARVRVCLQNDAKVPAETLRVFEATLQSLQRQLESEIAFETCRDDQNDHIRITVRGWPDANQEAGALGATRVRGGRLVGDIYVFSQAVRQLLPSRLPVYEGRALAAVAAHELGHYLGREVGHRRRGLMTQSLTAAHLMSPGALLHK